MTLEESYLILSDEQLYQYIRDDGKSLESNYVYVYQKEFDKVFNSNPSLAIDRYYSISNLIDMKLSRKEILYMTFEERIAYKYLFRH